MGEFENPVQLECHLPAEGNWSIEQLKLAFYFYCQIPFGKIHSKNPDILTLATLIGRSPGATAMKLVNFASLDPRITETGRKGLTKVSRLDKEIWDAFHSDWEKLAIESEELLSLLMADRGLARETSESKIEEELTEDYTGETSTSIIQYRIRQGFFRKSVLTNYCGKCCITGMSEPKLLVASHIVPWSADKSNRMNPHNGLCLSAIHDRAFDAGLLTISTDMKIVLSKALMEYRDKFMSETFLCFDGKTIERAERFSPGEEFLEYHRTKVFLR